MEVNAIIVIVSGANLVALLGLIANIWSWSNKLEQRLTRIEVKMHNLERSLLQSPPQKELSRSAELTREIFKGGS